MTNELQTTYGVHLSLIIVSKNWIGLTPDNIQTFFNVPYQAGPKSRVFENINIDKNAFETSETTCKDGVGCIYRSCCNEGQLALFLR